jgi:hypothetical protein
MMIPADRATRERHEWQPTGGGTFECTGCKLKGIGRNQTIIAVTADDVADRDRRTLACDVMTA